MGGEGGGEEERVAGNNREMEGLGGNRVGGWLWEGGGLRLGEWPGGGRCSSRALSAVFDAYQDSNPGHPKHLPFRTAADPSRTTTRENAGDKNAGRSPMGRVGIPPPPYVQSHIEDVNTEGTEGVHVDRPTTTSAD